MLSKLLASPKPSTDAILALQRERLSEAVRHARANSPLFAELYRHLPDTVTDPTMLPITTKPELMADFDRWVTDREITLESVQEFLDRPDLVGRPFLDKYLLTTTSGTTGRRGIFVISDEELGHVSRPQYRPSTLGALLPPNRAARLLAKRFRTGTIMPSSGHYGMVSLWKRNHGDGDSRNRSFSSLQPLHQLVDQLNEFDPVVVTSATTILELLAGEKAAGRLRIAPVLVIVSGETLSDNSRAVIESEFGASVVDLYAANEALRLSKCCAHGWQHVFTDWVVFEPVEEDYSPTPAGTLSHSVLISVLYRRTQPVLRYELGDAVLQRPDPCPCGSPYPAFKIEGRKADVLRDDQGQPVVVAQHLLIALQKRVKGIRQFQMIQEAENTMRLRMLPADGTDLDEAWPRVHESFLALLAEHGIRRFTIERSPEPPQLSAGGKMRPYIPADA